MLTLTQRLDRLEAHLTELELWLVRDYADLNHWRFDGEPLPLGQPWPARRGVHRLEHPGVQVPKEWPLEDTYLDLNVGGESLLTLRYSEEEERFGVNPHHEWFPLKERTFSVELESVARFEFGVPN